MDAPGGHVGRHQGPGPAGGERRQRPLPLGLRPVAVDGDGRHARGAELLDQPVGAVLGPAEDDGRTVPGHDVGGQGYPARRVGAPEEVADVAGLVLVGHHLVAARITLVAAHEHVDGTVEGGREQQGLAIGGRGVQQPPDGGQEAHVGHAVGFVHDGDAHVRQVDDPLGDQVLQPARAGDDDVDAALEGRPLRSVADAAVDGDHAPIDGRRQRHQLLADLFGQFPGGDEHESGRPAGPRLLGARRQREGEGQRLAGARRGAAGDVVAGQRVGQHGGLDGEGGRNAATVERRHERGGHAEVGEGGGQGMLHSRAMRGQLEWIPSYGDALRAHRQRLPASIRHPAGPREPTGKQARVLGCGRG